MQRIAEWLAAKPGRDFNMRMDRLARAPVVVLKMRQVKFPCPASQTGYLEIRRVVGMDNIDLLDFNIVEMIRELDHPEEDLGRRRPRIKQTAD